LPFCVAATPDTFNNAFGLRRLSYIDNQIDNQLPHNIIAGSGFLIAASIILIEAAFDFLKTSGFNLQD